MDPAHGLFDAGMVYVTLLGLAGAVLTAVTVRRPFVAQIVGEAQLRLLVAILAACAVATGLIVHDGWAILAFAALAMLVIVLLLDRLPRLSMAGAIEMAAQPLLMLTSVPWTFLLLRAQGFPGWALAVALGSSAIGILLFGFAFAARLARQAIFTHAAWRRPIDALAPCDGAREPKVSVHLCCYAEPPAVVIATMDQLAALDYANFEVLVCDNNTQDEALWRPLATHAARLNRDCGSERFRFFHVASLPGAKAGALNYCTTRMAADAEIVAVLDADYLAERDFLSRLVGFFDDPRIGYVQTPHDYRDYGDNAYLTSCYWEYMPNNKVVLPGINEYNAAFTIGTMCVIRAAALKAAGPWAEWCLTEDSELSIRLRQVGYDGVYLRDTFGRGLIPETFADYKKQRFRWTAGPVQQLRRYWRHYLPHPLGVPSGINGWSKLLELQRSAAPVASLMARGYAAVTAVAMILLTAIGVLPAITLPDAAFVAMAALAGSGLIATWLRYRLSGCERIGDMLRGEIAKASLTYVEMTAGIAGLSSRPQAWHRTPKFAAAASGLRAVRSTLPELAIGVGHLLLVALVIATGDRLGGHFVLVACTVLTLSSLRFFAAPAMALLSERALAGATGFVPPLPIAMARDATVSAPA